MDRDVPDMVQPCRSYCSEVIFRYPGLPMVRQNAQSGVVVKHLTHRELVYDTGIVGIDEYAWRYPWLRCVCSILPRNRCVTVREKTHFQHKPTTSVDSVHP